MHMRNILIILCRQAKELDIIKQHNYSWLQFHANEPQTFIFHA
jgi:hypothetical protein